MHLLTDRRRQSYSPSLAMDGHLCKRMQQTHVYGKSSMYADPVPSRPSHSFIPPFSTPGYPTVSGRTSLASST
jgi:hypothetical protein